MKSERMNNPKTELRVRGDFFKLLSYQGPRNGDSWKWFIEGFMKMRFLTRKGGFD